MKFYVLSGESDWRTISESIDQTKEKGKMSSIMDKSKLPTKMFLRSNSFQKLCSLAHPMRLRGFKSNREALKSVFESLIVTTRGVIQSVTHRILCLLFLTPFTKLLLLSRPLQGLVDAVATASSKDGRLNTVRLILKLTLSTIVSTDKKPQSADVRFDNELRLSEDDSTSPTGTTTTTPNAPECPRNHRPEPSVAEMAVQTDPEPEPEPEFFDCKEPPAERLKSCQFLESTLLPKRTPRRRSGQLAAAAVYGCVLCCAVQLSALVYLLSGDAVRFPPGLIFLMFSLAYIGFVMTRIFTCSTSDESDIRSKLATKKKSEQDIQGGTSKALVVATVPEGAIRKLGNPKGGLHPILAAVSKRILATLLQFQQPHEKTSSPTPRQSRSATRTRMLLCADDKTISKVKIL